MERDPIAADARHARRGRYLGATPTCALCGFSGTHARYARASLATARRGATVTCDALPTAVRVFAERIGAHSRRGSRRVRAIPDVALVFDTETTIDASQRLTFGAYRYLRLTPH